VLAGHPAADDAALCLSELASNAVLHSDSARLGGTFRVRITARSGLLRVEVDDDGGRWRADTRPDGQSGRGLVIVGTVAIAWGVSTAWRVSTGQAGCAVWLELPLI
jgi:anti-sigma regulatory factor (Ser/Thr protein kinase)